MIKIYTIGFAKKNAEEFFTKLKKAKVTKLIDVRLNNVSQLAGFANAKHLPYFLSLHGIDYVHREELAPTKELLDGYKKKSISWSEYEKQYPQILDSRNVMDKLDINEFDNAVLLCSEATEEQCHRRLLAEYLKGENSDIKVIHL